MTVDKEHLGKNVRKVRVAKGLRQSDVASMLHCSRSAYSYKENGLCWFTIGDLTLIADIFQISLEALVYGKSDKGGSVGKRTRKYQKT